MWSTWHRLASENLVLAAQLDMCEPDVASLLDRARGNAARALNEADPKFHLQRELTSKLVEAIDRMAAENQRACGT